MREGCDFRWLGGLVGGEVNSTVAFGRHAGCAIDTPSDRESRNYSVRRILEKASLAGETLSCRTLSKPLLIPAIDSS